MSERLYQMDFAKLYPLCVQKAEKKGRTKAEVDQIIFWLTGHDENTLSSTLTGDTTVEGFFNGAPKPNPARDLVTGVVCGVRVEEVADPLMREIRTLDRLVDELTWENATERTFSAPA